MSRALGIVVREVSQCTYTLCVPTMRGTRDMISSLIRLPPQWEHSSHAEIDMNDQYWAISRSEVKTAFEWGLSRLRNKRHGHGIFKFSLSKLHRHLDKLGHAVDENYDIVNKTDVRTYLHWDLDHNTLLTMGPLILTQSPMGVAIGGFLSSWEAELWCMWHESISLHQHRTDTIHRWRTALQATSADAGACGALSLTLLQPAPFNTMHSHAGVAGLDRMRRRLAATTLTTPTVAAEGYMPWWHPFDTIWGFFENDTVIVPILSPLAYDGDWDGRNGALIQATPRREHHILKQFLRNVPTLAPFRSEAIFGWQEWNHSELHGPTPLAPYSCRHPHPV